jgi:small subunit ribosomal protein S3
MEEKKFVKIRKEEFAVKEYIKKEFGMGKVSTVKIDYTPVGERITVSTHKPGLIIGKRGETIEKLTTVLKKKFKMENPHIDIAEIMKPELDAQLVADEIALALERFGSMRFKAVSYRMLTRIKTAGALGAEIVTSGRLPSERAKTWRFKFGYLKKTGDDKNLVDRAESVSTTKQGVVGIKVSILTPDKKAADQIDVNDEMIQRIISNANSVDETEKKKTKRKIKN